jgi:hypothetical protein
MYLFHGLFSDRYIVLTDSAGNYTRYSASFLGFCVSIFKEWLVFSIGIEQEHFIYRDFEQPGNPECEIKRRIILLLLYREDCLPRHSKLVGQDFLGEVAQCPVDFYPVLHAGCPPVVALDDGRRMTGY